MQREHNPREHFNPEAVAEYKEYVNGIGALHTKMRDHGPNVGVTKGGDAAMYAMTQAEYDSANEEYDRLEEIRTRLRPIFVAGKVPNPNYVRPSGRAPPGGSGKPLYGGAPGDGPRPLVVGEPIERVYNPEGAFTPAQPGQSQSNNGRPFVPRQALVGQPIQNEAPDDDPEFQNRPPPTARGADGKRVVTDEQRKKTEERKNKQEAYIEKEYRAGRDPFYRAENDKDLQEEITQEAWRKSPEGIASRKRQEDEFDQSQQKKRDEFANSPQGKMNAAMKVLGKAGQEALAGAVQVGTLGAIGRKDAKAMSRAVSEMFDKQGVQQQTKDDLMDFISERGIEAAANTYLRYAASSEGARQNNAEARAGREDRIRQPPGVQSAAQAASPNNPANNAARPRPNSRANEPSINGPDGVEPPDEYVDRRRDDGLRFEPTADERRRAQSAQRASAADARRERERAVAHGERVPAVPRAAPNVQDVLPDDDYANQLANQLAEAEANEAQEDPVFGRAPRPEDYIWGSGKRMRLTGGRMGDMFPMMTPGVNINEKFNPSVGTYVHSLVREGYTKKTADWIRAHRYDRVYSLSVIRKPLKFTTVLAINAITAGQFGSISKSMNYDRFFHLMLLVNGQWIFEKTTGPEIRPYNASEDSPSTAESMDASTPTNMNVEDFLENTQRSMGKANYFTYNGFRNNCQNFVISMLKSNGVLTLQLRDFVLQPIEELIDRLPSHTEETLNVVTDTTQIYAQRDGAEADPFAGSGKKRKR